MNEHILGTGSMMEPLAVDEWETLIPVRDQILIQPDPPKKQTKGGIVLPDELEIPSVRGLVVAVSYLITQTYEQADVPEVHRIEPGDRVIFRWYGAMPQDMEKASGNILISINNVLAKVKKEKKHERRTAQPVG